MVFIFTVPRVPEVFWYVGGRKMWAKEPDMIRRSWKMGRYDKKKVGPLWVKPSLKSRPKRRVSVVTPYKLTNSGIILRDNLGITS